MDQGERGVPWPYTGLCLVGLISKMTCVELDVILAYILSRLFTAKNRAVFVRFSLGGSEFRLATSDYSRHGGCQIGTVE